MMKFGLVVAVYCFFHSEVAIGQGVSIELSVKWKKVKHTLMLWPYDNPSTLTPFLQLTYRNLTNSPIYFPKVLYSNNNGFPLFSPEFINTHDLPQEWMDIVKRQAQLTPYVLREYVVKIGQCPDSHTSSHSWFQLFDSKLDLDIEAGISFNLYRLNWAFVVQYGLESRGVGKSLRFFNPDSSRWIDYYDALPLALSSSNGNTLSFTQNKLNAEGISTVYNDYFLFLDVGEFHVEELNLSAFLAYPNSYKFKLDCATQKFSGFFKFDDDEIALPDSIEDYLLYKGYFVSNEVTLFTTGGQR